MNVEPLSEEAVVVRLRAIVRSVLDMEKRYDVDASAITGDTPLLSLPIDSLALMYVMNGVEESFGVELPDEQIVAFTSVRSLVDYVLEQRSPLAAMA